MRPKRKQRRVGRPQRKNKQIYYYLYAKNGDDGRPLISGPYDTSSEASNVAYSNNVEEFDVIPLNTRNQAEATRRIKGMRLNEGVDLNYAATKFKHDWDKFTGE